MPSAAIDLDLCKCAHGGAGQPGSISPKGLAVRAQQGSALHATALCFMSPSSHCGNY